MRSEGFARQSEQVPDGRLFRRPPSPAAAAHLSKKAPAHLRKSAAAP
jgi:hypothetical protein